MYKRNFHIAVSSILLLITSCSFDISQPPINNNNVSNFNNPEIGFNSLNNNDTTTLKILGQEILDHPRLIFTTEQENKIKASINTDPQLASLLQLLRTKANAELSLQTIPFPNGVVDVDNTILSISRDHLYKIITLALAYRMFEDVKYAEKAREHIINACTYPTWNPAHFLDVAEMTTAVAIGYDWLYSFLSDNDKNLIINSLKEKSINLALKEYASPVNNSWSIRETNWNVVCNSGISLGAIAIAEEFYRTSPTIPERILDHGKRHMPTCLRLFSPDGVCFEGPAYWQYTLNYYSMISKTLHDNVGNDLGLSDIPGIKNSAHYYFQTLSPTKKIFNFADSFTTESSQSPLFFYYGKYFNQPHLSSFFKEQINDVLSNKVSFPKSIFFFSIAWYDTNNEFEYEKPGLETFQNTYNPIAVFNGNAQNPKSIYLIAKGGAGNMPHQQLDMGTFIVETQGIRWFDDLGSDDYSLPGFWDYKATGQRWNYFRNTNFSHNVPHIDNKIQYSPGRGWLEKDDSTLDEPYAIFNLSSAYTNQLISFKRGFKLLNDEVMLLQDEFIMNNSGQVVTESFITRADIQISDSIASLNIDGKNFYLKVISPDKVTISKAVAKELTSLEKPVKGFNLLKFTITTTQKTEIVRCKILMGSNIDEINKLSSGEFETLNDWKEVVNSIPNVYF